MHLEESMEPRVFCSVSNHFRLFLALLVSSAMAAAAGGVAAQDEAPGPEEPPAEEEETPPEAPEQPPEAEKSSDAGPILSPEMGVQCRDGIDNDGNGVADCHEPHCQETKFCEDVVFYVPEPKDKAPGLLMSLGAGFALPNWQRPEDERQSDDKGRQWVVPYGPDFGAIANLAVALLPTHWFGVGLQGMFAGAAVQSKHTWYDESKKFDGFKIFFHTGAFVRFQLPFEWVVPFINLSSGFSFAQYRWITFTRTEGDTDARRSGDNIVDPPTYHATFAAEIGIDFYLIKRFLAIGLKGYAPFAATEKPGTDNTALMITGTITPFWPEEETIHPDFLPPSEDEPAEDEPSEDEPAAE